MGYRLSNAPLLMLVLLISGCIILPIPTTEYGGDPLATNEQLKALEQGLGRMSRQDVIDLVGPPRETYGDGTVAVYRWEMKQGKYIVVPLDVSGTAAPVTITGRSEHRLCLRYSDDGVLDKVVHFDSALSDKDDDVNELITAWLTEFEPGLGTGHPSSARAAGNSTIIDGVLVYFEEPSMETCTEALVLKSDGRFRILPQKILRNEFYPWLEPFWEHNVPSLATESYLIEARKKHNLNFLVVASDSQHCQPEGNWTTSCYYARYGDRTKSMMVTLVDLRNTASRREEEINSVHIPVFEDTKLEACLGLMPYIAADIRQTAGVR